MKLKLFLLVFLSIIFASCSFIPFVGSMVSNTTEEGGASLTFDIGGASAVAGVSSDGSRAISRVIDGPSARLTDGEDASLVKVLSDGTIESIMTNESDYGGWKPTVSFMSVGEDGSIYICFEGSISTYFDGGNIQVQFVRVRPDSTYDVLWPDPSIEDNYDSGQIDTWGALWMNQDPLIRGNDGKLYFKVANWSSSGQDDSIYMYDPNTGEFPIKVTPNGVSLSITSFKIDKNNHLFIQSEGWDGDSRFLRYYTLGSTGFKNIYYSSDQNTWTRGYVTSSPAHPEDFVIINGSGIQDMSGIIKATITADATATNNDVIDFELLYSDTQNGNWINLYKYYNEGWDRKTNLLKQTMSSWAAISFNWVDEVLASDGTSIDSKKLLAKIQPYFYGANSLTTEGETLILDGTLTKKDSVSGSTEHHELWEWITQYPEDFLRDFFTGTLMKDWLADNGMSNIYFGNIGDMLWLSDGALYGIYDNSWWGGGESDGTKVLKLLDVDGERDLKVVSLQYGDRKPSKITINGDYLYYRYAVLDSNNQETGLHNLARVNMITGTQEDLLPANSENLEILDYDISEDNNSIYYVGLSPQTNAVYSYKVDLLNGISSVLSNSMRLSNIKVVE